MANRGEIAVRSSRPAARSALRPWPSTPKLTETRCGGEAALMTMLQSCSPGLVVVNVDNGFGAGAAAALIAKQVASKSSSQHSSLRAARSSRATGAEHAG